MNVDLMPSAKQAWAVADAAGGFSERCTAVRAIYLEARENCRLDGLQGPEALTFLMDAAFVAGMIYGVRKERRRKER